MTHPTEPSRTSLPASDVPQAESSLERGLAALRDWSPYLPPPPPFPADWRSDVASWLERICDPDDAPTGAWAWKCLALLARHAEGRVALEAHTTFKNAVAESEQLRDHLEFHVLCCRHHFDDELADGTELDLLALVRRETAEALVELLEPVGGELRDQLDEIDARVCRHVIVEPEVPVRPTMRNALWTDDHEHLLSDVGCSTPLDWWAQGLGYGFRREVLEARAEGPEAEARVREAFASRRL